MIFRPLCSRGSARRSKKPQHRIAHEHGSFTIAKHDVPRPFSVLDNTGARSRLRRTPHATLADSNAVPLPSQIPLATVVDMVSHTIPPASPVQAKAKGQAFSPPKPTWVRNEVIRLKALMPHAGCRTVAHSFNRRWASRRQATVAACV